MTLEEQIEHLTDILNGQIKLNKHQAQELTAAQERIKELEEEKKFLYKQVERGLFDKHTSPELALKNLFYNPSAPWNDEKWTWDVSHKEYAEAFKQALKENNNKDKE